MEVMALDSRLKLLPSAHLHHINAQEVQHETNSALAR